MPLLSSAATQSTIVSDTDSRTCPDTHSRLPSKLSDIILDSLSGHIVVSLSDIILDSVSDMSWNTQCSRPLKSGRHGQSLIGHKRAPAEVDHEAWVDDALPLRYVIPDRPTDHRRRSQVAGTSSPSRRSEGGALGGPLELIHRARLPC